MVQDQPHGTLLGLSGILFGMGSIFLPDSKGSGIKPGTVHH
jgi:hypothetical protein